MRLSGEWLRPLAGNAEPVALSSLAGKRVHAVAGIGNPARFFAQLAAAGLEVIAHAFPDHHRYRAAELEFGDDLGDDRQTETEAAGLGPEVQEVAAAEAVLAAEHRV